MCVCVCIIMYIYNYAYILYRFSVHNCAYADGQRVFRHFFDVVVEEPSVRLQRFSSQRLYSSPGH